MNKQFVLLVIAVILFGCSHRNDEPVIEDKELGIMWTGHVSESSMTFDEALVYCRNLTYHGHTDWRLPTRSELESMINPSLIDQSPDSSVVPLYGPFSTPSEGYVFSGTIVSGYTNAPYVMNLRNGHVFNGQGYAAYVRAVRDLRFEAK